MKICKWLFISGAVYVSNVHQLLLLKYSTHNNKSWITTGIETSCKHKKELYLINGDSNNSKLKAHYKSYCIILSKVIKAAKQLYYNNKISKSNSKIKTTWDIIKMETCKNHKNKGTQLINIDGNLITNQQLIANSFNNYITVADKITSNIKTDKTSLNCSNPVHCLHKNFKLPCSNMKLKYTIPKEIEKIIKSQKSKNCHGYDGIPTKILEVSTPFIIIIINLFHIPLSYTDVELVVYTFSITMKQVYISSNIHM